MKRIEKTAASGAKTEAMQAYCTFRILCTCVHANNSAFLYNKQLKCWKRNTVDLQICMENLSVSYMDMPSCPSKAMLKKHRPLWDRKNNLSTLLYVIIRNETRLLWWFYRACWQTVHTALIGKGAMCLESFCHPQRCKAILGQSSLLCWGICSILAAQKPMCPGRHSVSISRPAFRSQLARKRINNFHQRRDFLTWIMLLVLS